MPPQVLSIVERAARAIHLIAGLICFRVAGWFCFVVEPFNPFGFWGFLAVGVMLAAAGKYGRLKDVLLSFIP